MSTGSGGRQAVDGSEKGSPPKGAAGTRALIRGAKSSRIVIVYDGELSAYGRSQRFLL